MATETILIDETPLLASKSGQGCNNPDLLNSFLNCCSLLNKERKYALCIAPATKKRLGMKWYYRPFWMFRTITDMHKQKIIEQSEIRTEAKQLIRFVLRPKRKYWKSRRDFDCFFPLKCKKHVLDLFVYANAQKAHDEGIVLTPSTTIPMEVCEIAYVAHTHGCKLVSTNMDFNYFRGYGGQTSYIDFLNLDNFLTRSFNS